MIFASIGSITGVGGAVWEGKYENDTNFMPAIEANATVINDTQEELEELQALVQNLRIQNCLLVNEINRLSNGVASLQQCTPH